MKLTPRIIANLAMEEGIACESYLDSDAPPNWTWALGLTAAASIDVRQYIDRPAPLIDCIMASIAELNRTYVPAVNRAFAGNALNDAQMAAALSFEWNTGAIGTAHWVRDWIARKTVAARRDLTNDFLGAGKLKARRAREAALFFAGTWPTDMRCPVWQVSKPGHRPVHPVPTDIMPMLQQILGGQ